MPTVSVPRSILKYLYGALLALYLAAPAYAFTPAQVPLLSSSAVPPNLMLLVDNSGSMYNIIWASGFDSTVARTPVSYLPNCLSGPIVVPCADRVNIAGGEALSLTDVSALGFNVGSISLSLQCLTGGIPIYRNNIKYCMKLPDPAGEGQTRYTADYLSWLMDLVPQRNGFRDYTNGVIPNDYRMNVAKNVATNLVDNNKTLRIGLAQFNEPRNDDRGDGGRISRVIADLSPVTATVYQPTAVTQTQATANINTLKNAINALTPSANTPMAETYYEITRYFRGMASYYPSAQTTYTSPIQYRCQKNYGVVITDGLPTYDRTFPTNDPDDVADSTRSLPNWDLNAANDGDDQQGIGKDRGNGEGDTLYLDDLAQFAYDIDMRKAADGSDLTGRSWDTTGFNKQNMSTYTIGFTLSNQMLIDAADNNHGHGKYYQTSDSAGLTAALNLALSDIYAKAGSGGGGATNSTTLSSGTRFYQTFYDPSDWHGTIQAFNLNATTGALSAAVWTTDSLITNTTPGPIFESWSTAATPTKITLNYANFTTAQKAILDANLPTGVTGTNLIAWTQGTANAKLRPRTRLLGDIINSPLTAALPSDKTSGDITGNTSYSTYLTTKAANMNYSLLVNTNDGFFNVINSDTGARRYAYMPSTALASLATIASTNYGTSTHKFTVDGQIAVFDTQLNTSWRTVAYGGTGAGGKAYFAIRLFEGSANTINALWEVKAPDTNTPANVFNNLGYAYSKPDVARMNDAAGTGIVVLGNGYGSFAGNASLFVLNANTGALIREIPIPAQSGETDNGLSSVKLRVNSQNIVQAAYAGDLKGRLWKFDLSSATPSAWSVNSQPLFTAPNGAAQPITVQPLLLDHPINGKMVYFGTGKFSEVSDKTTTGQQAFYAIWDADGATGGYTQSNLQPQTITGSITGNGATYFTTSNNDVDWAVKKGWYMALATTAPYIGERIIYAAQTSRGRIIFTTAAVNSTDPCESTGTGRLFELDAAKGGMLNYQVLDTNGDGRIDASDTRVSGIGIGTGIPNLAAIVAGGTGVNDTKYLIDSSGGPAVPLAEKGGNVYQRIMWRQIQ